MGHLPRREDHSLVGLTTTPIVVPIALLTSPIWVEIFVNIVEGMPSVYKKIPGKGVVVPSSGCRSKSSTFKRWLVGLVDLVRV